jgi:hypothetical protein
MKKSLVTVIILIVGALLLISIFVFSPQQSNPNQNSTTTPPVVGVITPAASTSTFASTILGLSWNMPVDKVFAEKIDTSKGDKNPFNTWTISGAQVAYAIRATNSETVTFSYEGPGPVLKYGGEDIKDICTSKTMFDQKSYDIKVLNCEEKVNPNGVSYAVFDIEFKDISGYGFLPGVFGIKVAQAEAGYGRAIGTVLQTKSKEFPGLSFYRYWYSGDDLSQIPSIKKDIQAAVDTIKYAK